MSVFTAVVLTMLTFAFIISPLLRRRAPSVDSVEDERSQELYSKRDTTYSMLKELEFDFQSGIITGEDYSDLEARYKRKAIAILRGIDELKEGANIADELEKRVLELRRGRSLNMEGELEKEILKRRRTKARFCPQCRTRYQQGDRFCSHCGASLAQGGRID